MSALAPVHEHNATQQHYFDHEIVDPEFEIARPRTGGRFYSFLMHYKVRTALALTATDLAGASVLHLCAGSGMDAEIVARNGGRVTCTDVSVGALERASQRAGRYGLDFRLTAADAEHLPFADGSFDYAFVHDGLHHLERPESALAEMSRVSRRGVIVTEPADAALTAIGMRLGVIEAREAAGNEVYRFHPGRLQALFVRLGRPVVRHQRYLMKYPHQPGRIFRLLDLPIIYELAQAAFLIFGARLLARLGNKLAIVALAPSEGSVAEGV